MFTTAIPLNSKFTQHTIIQLTVSKKGNLKDAKYFFNKAINLNSNFKEALNNLGNTLSASGNLKESINFFIRAIKIDPNYIEAWSNIIVPFEVLKNSDSENKTYLNNIQNKRIPDENVYKSILNYRLQIGKENSYTYFNKVIDKIKQEKEQKIKNNNFIKNAFNPEDTEFKNIFSLLHFGRSGTGLLHSLIDNHKKYLLSVFI